MIYYDKLQLTRDNSQFQLIYHVLTSHTLTTRPNSLQVPMNNWSAPGVRFGVRTTARAFSVRKTVE